MTTKRAELLKRLDETLRKVGAQSVLMSDTVGRLVGLNSTDLECLDLLYLAGVTTAGRLASHTGLTTGAMTAVIDRLEDAGFVRRLRDPHDRRRVLVEALPGSMSHIEPLYSRLAATTARLHAGTTIAAWPWWSTICHARSTWSPSTWPGFRRSLRCNAYRPSGSHGPFAATTPPCPRQCRAESEALQAEIGAKYLLDGLLRPTSVAVTSTKDDETDVCSTTRALCDVALSGSR